MDGFPSWAKQYYTDSSLNQASVNEFAFNQAIQNVAA